MFSVLQTKAQGNSHVPKIDHPIPVHIPRYSNESEESFDSSKGLFLLCPNPQKTQTHKHTEKKEEKRHLRLDPVFHAVHRTKLVQSIDHDSPDLCRLLPIRVSHRLHNLGVDKIKDAVLMTPGCKASNRFRRSAKLVGTSLSWFGGAVATKLVKDGLVDDIVPSDEFVDCGLDQLLGVDGVDACELCCLVFQDCLVLLCEEFDRIGTTCLLYYDVFC